MKTPKRKNMNFRNNKGQILVLFPFIVVFLFGLILLVIDVSAMVETRIQLQTATDIAARDGALWQAYFIDQISSINGPLAYYYGLMTPQCVCRWPPQRWTKYCKGWVAANKAAKACISTQSVLQYGVSAAVFGVVIKSATDNGASLASLMSNPIPSLTRTFAISPGYDVTMNFLCYDVVSIGRPAGLLLRKDISWGGGSYGSCHIGERIDVWAYKNGAPAYGSAILGKGLQFPKFRAKSSARPYWLGCVVTGKHDPRKDNLSGGVPFVNENYDCMLQGRWDAKLVAYDKY